MFEYDPKKSICTCARVTYADMAEAVEKGAKTVADIREKTRATAFCGSCTERVENFLNQLLAGEAKAMELPEEPDGLTLELPCEDKTYTLRIDLKGGDIYEKAR